MVDYEIGYGKPPRHSQFKKGVCANPRGRPRRRDTQIGDVVRGFLSGKAQYREKGRTRKTSRLELAIKRHATAALDGDVGSAALLLKMRAHGMKFGDAGPLIITIVNPPGLVARRRAEEEGRLADPSGDDFPRKAPIDGESAMLLADRPLSASDADDAAREATFGDWPADAQVCRVTSLDGREVASVGRVPTPRATR